MLTRCQQNMAKEKFRVNANSEEQAKEIAKKHPFYPIGGEIIKVRYAAYKRKN